MGQHLITLEGGGKSFTGKRCELTVLQSGGQKHTDRIYFNSCARPDFLCPALRDEHCHLGSPFRCEKPHHTSVTPLLGLTSPEEEDSSLPVRLGEGRRRGSGEWL